MWSKSVAKRFNEISTRVLSPEFRFPADKIQSRSLNPFSCSRSCQKIAHEMDYGKGKRVHRFFGAIGNCDLWHVSRFHVIKYMLAGNTNGDISHIAFDPIYSPAFISRFPFTIVFIILISLENKIGYMAELYRGELENHGGINLDQYKTGNCIIISFCF